MIKALDRGKKPPQPNAAFAVGKTLDKAPFWMVYLPSAADLAKLRQEIDRGGVATPPALRTAAPAASGLKEVTLTLDVGANEEIKLNTNIRCKDADDAGKVKGGIEAMRDQIGLGFQFLAMAPPQPGLPKIGPTLMQDWNTLAFTTQGNNVTGTIRVSAQTIEDLARIGAAQKNQPQPPIAPKKF